MKITSTTDLTRLMELMGTESTRDEASRLRDLLIERGVTNTDDVTDGDWVDMVADAVNS